jgi:DNA-binding PadR family transcriptional regulator
MRDRTTPPERRSRHRDHDPLHQHDHPDLTTSHHPAFGPFGFGGPGSALGRLLFGRGPKARRGDVRAAALLLLADSPANGYQLMQEIESRSEGMWRPSPGSIYPVLQQLEDEGLVRPHGPEGRRVFELTDEGRSHVREHAEEFGEPWSTVADSVGGNAADFRGLLGQVAMAASQVMRAGSQRQVSDAQAVLADARRRLYRILAEDEPAEDEAPASLQGRR